MTTASRAYFNFERTFGLFRIRCWRVIMKRYRKQNTFVSNLSGIVKRRMEFADVNAFTALYVCVCVDVSTRINANIPWWTLNITCVRNIFFLFRLMTIYYSFVYNMPNGIESERASITSAQSLIRNYCVLFDHEGTITYIRKLNDRLSVCIFVSHTISVWWFLVS